MTQPFDPIALRIGKTYRLGLSAYVEAGRLLIERKASLKHGEWLPWLKANADALGFNTDRTAQYLMKCATENPKLASDLPTQSLAIWGHQSRTSAASAAERWRGIDRWRPNDHWHANDECYTPFPVMQEVRKVLGIIDLDPASCLEGQRRIKAKRHYTKETDALTKDWKGRVFLNPPYSTLLIKAFVDKFLAEWETGRIDEAIVLTLNKIETRWGQLLGSKADAICFWRRVIAFDKPSGEEPNGGYWGHMFCYFGPNKETFAEVFAEQGLVMQNLSRPA